MPRYLTFFVLLFAPVTALACGAPSHLLTAPPQQILRGLEKNNAPYLAAMDDYSIAMEACYDGPQGPLQLAPHVKAAQTLHINMAAMRRLAEDAVRDNEFSYEALLSSPLWGDIEAMRVAAAYSEAWGALAMAVRQISAEDKKQALAAATKAMQQLTFEFKHPVVVQRAMYGLATAQIEGGGLALAVATLTRLKQSLARGGDADFKKSVDAFYARITAPGYQPPAPLFEKPETGIDPNGRLVLTGKAGEDAVKLARIAMGEARPASEIIGILEPALRGTRDSARAALALIARDQLLLRAMDYAPGPSLRVMRRAFADGQYGQLVASWPDLKPYYPLLPEGLKRQVDYQMGVARLNLGELALALDHLRAARKTTPPGTEAVRLDKLIVLARLSLDKVPDAPRIALAKQYMRPASKTQKPRAIDDALPTPEAALDEMLDLRARIVLARHAATQADWAAADGFLTGIGPTQPAYQLFLGMRVRLLAEAVRGRMKEGESAKDISSTARGGHILYRLWRDSACPPGCPKSNYLAVHRAAFETALMGKLPSTAFGYGWGGYVEAGGDIKPFVERALAYLVDQADAERLLVLLENDNEELAAFILNQWKSHLRGRAKKPGFDGRYQFLGSLADMQGRPQAVLLEALIEHDLAQGDLANALLHAEALAAGFPRRPSAWFWRAAALQANQRGLEAARALSSLAQRTPSDDPVGMGARLGLAALFVELERGAQACAMREKIFSRPQAGAHWRAAAKVFPPLNDWQKTIDDFCR